MEYFDLGVFNAILKNKSASWGTPYDLAVNVSPQSHGLGITISEITYAQMHLQDKNFVSSQDVSD